MMPSVDRTRRKRVIRVVQASLSALGLVAIFGLTLPKIASYSDVWATIKALTSAMPGLTLGQAAVSNQTSTTVSNVVPGAGVVGFKQSPILEMDETVRVPDSPSTTREGV